MTDVAPEVQALKNAADALVTEVETLLTKAANPANGVIDLADLDAIKAITTELQNAIPAVTPPTVTPVDTIPPGTPAEPTPTFPDPTATPSPMVQASDTTGTSPVEGTNPTS